jgi:hypothetical protein
MAAAHLVTAITACMLVVVVGVLLAQPGRMMNQPHVGGNKHRMHGRRNDSDSEDDDDGLPLAILPGDPPPRPPPHPPFARALAVAMVVHRPPLAVGNDIQSESDHDSDDDNNNDSGDSDDGDNACADQCPHLRCSDRGSNRFISMRKCLDCGHLLWARPRP